MKIIEDEVIGELRYLTVEFDQAELLAGHIGVISQGAVRRYFEGKSPDLKVKKCGGLKLDSQRDIVTMRFGVVNQLAIENSVGVNSIVTNTSPGYGDPKLLNPGYDELKKRFELRGEVYIVLEKEHASLQGHRDELEKLVSNLVIERDDLLVENEELKTANAQWKEKYDALTKAVGITALATADEDAADLANAKEAVEITGADGSKITGEKAEGGVRGDRHKEIIIADLESDEDDDILG